jgi:hypothetical protein
MSIFTTHDRLQRLKRKALYYSYLLLIFSIFTTHARLQRLQRKALYYSYLLLIFTTHMLAFSAKLCPKLACTERRSYLLLIFTTAILSLIFTTHIARVCAPKDAHTHIYYSYLLLIY